MFDSDTNHNKKNRNSQGGQRTPDARNKFNDVVEELKRRPIPESMLTPAKGNTFVCIGCGNGSGEHGYGATLNEDCTRLLCPKQCGKANGAYSYIDVACHYYGVDLETNFAAGVRALCEHESIQLDKNFPQEYKPKENPEKKIIPELQELIISDIEKSKARLSSLPEKEKRGLSDETLNEFQIGVDFQWTPPQNRLDNKKSYPSLRVIIPFLSNSSLPNFQLNYCAALFVDERERLDAQGKEYVKYLHGGGRTPFGLNTLRDAEKIFTTEGEYDALSIWQATGGKYPCLATGGTAINNLFQALTKFYSNSKKPKILFVADNDSAGKNFAEKFCKDAKENGFIAVPSYLAPLDAQKLDANKILIEQGDKKLAEMIETLIDDAQIEFEKIETAERKALLGQNAADYFAESLFDYLEVQKQFADRKTGFSNLDAEIEGILPGVYIIGGLPALGKTTFTLQLLHQMAQSGEICILCSYEMSKHLLYCKIAARETYRIESKNFSCHPQHVLTATNINKSKFYEHRVDFDAALISLRDLENLTIWEMDNPNIDDLLKRLEKICLQLEKPPIICVDYLQLLAVGSENVKNALDAILLKLKTFQRKYNVTFFVISSLNRTNYATDISFQAFKESGGVEYSADCIWGLQFLFDEQASRTNEDIEKAKKDNPRKIQLKCLKNRFGANFDIGFFYYPAVDLFLPMDEYGDYTEYQQNKNGEIVKVKGTTKNGKKSVF